MFNGLKNEFHMLKMNFNLSLPIPTWIPLMSGRKAEIVITINRNATPCIESSLNHIQTHVFLHRLCGLHNSAPSCSSKHTLSFSTFVHFFPSGGGLHVSFCFHLLQPAPKAFHEACCLEDTVHLSPEAGQPRLAGH